jgi:hypothetical protein
MFRNNQTRNLLITFGGILASLLALHLGSSIDDVSASTEPDFMLGNVSTSLTMPQASQLGNLSEQDLNLLSEMRQESNGNLTKLNMLLLDEMERRNIINNVEKQELLTLVVGTANINPTNNLTIIDNEVSSMLDTVGRNTTNPTVVALKSTLGRIVDLRPDIIVPSNGTLSSGNITGGISGLPPLTIDASSTLAGIEKNAKVQTCALVGSIIDDGLGAGVGGIVCNYIL